MRVRVRARAMTVWSIALAWPEGVPFDGAGRDLAPAHYAHALVEFVRARRAAAADKFVLSVHAALPAELVDALVRAAGASPVHVRTCAADDFRPTAERLVPLLDPMDFTRGEEVVVADVHDSFRVQDALLRALRAAMPTDGAALTCWPAVSSGGLRPCGLNVPGVPLPIESADPSEYHWHFDAGLAVSTDAFRRRAAARGGGFAAFLARFVRDYRFERGADEAACEAYLCTMAPLLREAASLAVHRERRRAVRASARLRDHYPPPAYAAARRDARACCALEPECDHAAVKERRQLCWQAARARTKRSRSP